MGEKRKYMRFNLFVDAVCRTGNGMLKKMKINNFSKEGVGVISSDALKEGEDVEIEMMIPGDNVPVLFQGKVAWANIANANGRAAQGGVRFKKISNEDKGRILEYIYQNWIVPIEPGVK
ncbi:MAG: PilZ domain-containing protein [Candidatus Omnitrophica bacterium]|nr:PilZ domain-containing protein [Candidatus Omnitrophota bacterium]